MVEIKVQDKEKDESTAETAAQEDIDIEEAAQQAQETQEEESVSELPLEQLEKPDLIERVKAVQATSDKNYELFLRAHAEMENLKKRFQRDKSELTKYSHEALTKQLLTVIDNLEKAIEASHHEHPLEAVKEGIELTLKGLMDILQKSGLSEVEAQGQPFDPNFHEAISEQEDNDVTPGTVVQVFQKGYTLNDRLIRPAMVVVSKASDK